MPGETSTGLEPNVAGLLCYALGWVTGIVFLLLEKEDRFVRFHALQSIAVFLPLTVLMAILGAVFWPLQVIVSLATFALWIVLMIKALQGERFKLPWAGDFAERYC